ncbi:ABC transporter ATP-binding protein [Lactobacillus sp. LC28-10]|uniref:ABC transporter ATP-binding protein n=1 Tax=Secundilactobacillus angelensis TaxID=2722706 RepID=A0ABX1KZU3_9LACO|nr:ABC transporter ATP-binding protein [Secundilactobacillus angelensis]MCH5462688.1 ABC transporter ATP-binding protein [Secundilactobacillus angelensis]NLR18800.1 ABC transporter ATP-binding protein [Secundilactobacillus angelensis]
MELKHVNYGYPGSENLITDFTATVPTGKILSIIGQNGAGKSTLLKLLMGAISPSSGSVEMDGHAISTLSSRQRAAKIALVTQQHQVYDEMTVKEVVKTGRLPFHSLLTTISDEEVRPFLETVNLADAKDRLLTSLSGGQQQRVWLATALAQEPQYLFLDEPTTYLDIRYQHDLMTLIQQLNTERHITIVMVLHDINQALKISDEVWLIKAGQLIQAGLAETVLNEQLLSNAFELPIKIVNIEKYGPYVIQLTS